MSQCSATLLRAYPVPCSEHEPGGSRLSAGDRLVSVSPPSTGDIRSRTFWSEPVSRFGSSSLTAFISGSRYVEPLTQPSASTGFRLPVSRVALAGLAHPHGRLHCQCASHKAVSRPCAAPRLPAAEHRVALRPTGVMRQLSARLLPRLTTHFHRMAAGFRPRKGSS